MLMMTRMQNYITDSAFKEEIRIELLRTVILIIINIVEKVKKTTKI